MKYKKTGWNEDKYEKLRGRKVVEANASDESVELKLDDGSWCKIDLYGDCCSHSYFTDPTQFQELVGATVNEVEDRENKTESESEYDSQTIWSFLVFTTDKGHITIDWRNDSNGYYSGYIETNYRKAAVS